MRFSAVKLDWRVALLFLGTVRAGRDMSELEALYQEGTTPDTTDVDGTKVATLSQPLPQGNPIPRDTWQADCTSEADGHTCKQSFDGNNSTYWQSLSTTTAQNITINLGKADWNISGLTVVPRQDQQAALIEEHQIFVSTNKEDWTLVAYGTWWPDQSQKLSAFQPRKAQYLRLSASAPNGIDIQDIKIYNSVYIQPNPALGAWGPTIDLPLVPVSGAVDVQTGEVVGWSSWGYNIFVEGKSGKTQTTTWNGGKQSVTRRTVDETEHDMFCPGISIDQDGKVVVTGGVDGGQTSIYNTSNHEWYEGEMMNTFRGYQATTTLSDGRIFVIGGSWNGGVGLKNGEVYNPEANTWKEINGAQASKMLTNDQRTYRQDNHAWLFGWTGGSVFQAGPSEMMNWFGTSGSGTTAPAGNRTGDNDAMCGNAVMYDQGKILGFGGSPDYENSEATKYAAIIEIGKVNETAKVTQNAGGGMQYKRTFHSSVVLPDGTVFVHGGQVVGLPFNEDQAQMTPELFTPDPSNSSGGKWTPLLTNTIVRVYHSIALLLQDGTVFTGGGGLCGDCEANHFDGQIYTPAYLLKEDGSPRTRPTINTVSSGPVKAGDTVELTTDSDVKSASIIRYGSTTHTVNTDQRRIAVDLKKADGDGNKYTFLIPGEAGVALPGYYMLFVLSDDGTPSHSKNVHVVA
ncbi:unnamed protein product [Penicillium pancosmium]